MVSPQEPGRPWIDTNEFTRTGQHLSGNCPIADLERLDDMLTDDDGLLDWALDGEKARRSDGATEAYLSLALSGRVRMRCVRCLEPVEVAIADRRQFKLVVTESIAEREDQKAEEFDLLVSSPRLDVLDLVEDEAIMALPLAPRHENCSPPLGTHSEDFSAAELSLPTEPDGSAATSRPHPFAVLAGLKTRRTKDDGGN